MKNNFRSLEEQHHILLNSRQRGFIEYYDNLVPQYLQDYYLNLIKGRMSPLLDVSMYYTENLTDMNYDGGEIGFGNVLQENGKDRFHPSSVPIFTPLYLLCNHLNLILSEVIQTRVWLQTIQQKSKVFKPHKDTDNPHYVLLYYVSESDGETVFYEQDEITEIKRISPKQGRIVFFDGSIPHSASNPTKDTRIVFNYNFIAVDVGMLQEAFPFYKSF